MKKVYVAANPADAHLVKGLLEGEKIEAIVRGEFLWGVRGDVPLPEAYPSVWVQDEDFEKASELVDAFCAEGKTAGQVPGAEWKCANCRETNDAQFTECWNCGRPRV